MNFFDDQLMLDSPLKQPKKTNNLKPSSNSYLPSTSNINSKTNIQKDLFDDLLDNMAAELNSKKNTSKEKYKQKSQQKYSQQFSYSPQKNFNQDFSKTVTQQQKWNFNHQNNLATQILSKNNQKGFQSSGISFHEDQLSQDGKSFKSGVTGKGSFANQKGSIAGFELGNTNFNQNSNTRKQTFLQPSIQPSLPPSSSMRSMRGPLRKKQSREASINNDDIVISTNFGNQLSSIQDFDTAHLPPMPSRKNQTNQSRQNNQNSNNEDAPRANLFSNFHNNQTPLRNFDLSISADKNVPQAKQKVIEKIVYVKQQNKQIKQQFQKELETIKSSYDRQLKFIQQNLDKQILAHKNTRNSLTKQFQNNLQNQKKKWKKIEQQNIQRIKSLNEWENKKKSDSYNLQIERLKSMLDHITKIQKDMQKSNNQTMTKQEIKQKQRSLQRQHKRLIELENSLNIKQKSLQIKQLDFQNLKNRHNEQIQSQKKKMYQLQNEIKRQQLESKRSLSHQKQMIASEIANAQLQAQKLKQNLKMERQELQLQRQLFEKQKCSMQQFNKKIMEGYKIKIKQLQQQKQRVHDIEVQLLKKIHTVQLMGNNAGVNLKKTENNFSLGNANKAFSNTDLLTRQHNKTKQNFKNQSNLLEQKLNNTKQRYAKMEQWTKKNSRAKSTNDNSHNTNLDFYLLKMNKGNNKIKNELWMN